ncbi:SRPBCC family protein [Sphingopyxis macrogoltabida]|uniref:Uncharacterized protein n=1 Tax=Sphingopyxis macrogoltabida TaxID=33050 RepID=A0AAC8YYR1_SPHMC|nr:hypothetical protein [Sphingopyxis macrogoltabida]ALJ14013.1 hypothetical protein LH19_14155 [Sphingopyxis macrogoltabida]AMU88552.1 hypothetical protein ATM17_05780 [Sphingopyxis macrogoltabida]
MTKPAIFVTIVNHLAADIAAEPDAVWADIIDTFAEARQWQADGYVIERIDEPAAVLSGYRMQLEQDGDAADRRIVHITERDDTERRLSLFVEFLSVPNDVLVYATYHAREAPGGVHYTIDCHTRMGIEPPAEGSRTAVATAIDGLKSHFEAHLTGYLERVKARLEPA